MSFLLYPLRMRVGGRRKTAVAFLILGICLIALAVALNVGWILLNLREVALLVFGVIFFALIITGLVLNTTFLLREIRRNEQQDAFLNAVTHELKTPIASIRLYLETLKTREVSEDKRREFYDIMISDSNRLLNTVEQVLQAGQTRERKNLLNISAINLEKLIKESIEITRSRYNLDENAIEFVGSANNVKISGDAAELQTVFTNLVDNAVKYSKDAVKISIRLKDQGDKNIEVHIKDSGVGIAPNELKRIFKRFYRISDVSTQKAKGTGLGLYIVRAIVKKHKGKIWAESEEKRGSTFIVQFPKIVD